VQTTPKKILITGGAGGLGAVFARRFAAQNHCIRIFDLPTPVNKKTMGAGAPGIEPVWGDVTDAAAVREAVRGVDEVIHMAAMLVPRTEDNPDLARKVNVGGTQNVLNAIDAESAASSKSIPLRFSSSVTVFGVTAHETPPIAIDHPLNPVDNYNGTKIQAEELIRNSGLPFSIFRFSAILYLQIRPGDFGQMRMIPPQNRIEMCHLFDVCDALLHALDNPEALGKTFILAGGPRCQMTYREQILRTFALWGFPEPAWEKFTDKPFYLDWYDTTESQRILQFQNRTFDDYLRDFSKALGWKQHAFKYLAAPPMRLLRIHV
jgi:nucleoside-diphosphate-sugar epimerase